MWWVLPDLLAGNAEQALGSGVEITVEHPDRLRTARDVLLQHEVWSLRNLERVIFGQELGGLVGDEDAPGCWPVLQQPRVDRLEHNWELTVLEELHDVGAVLWEGRVRSRHLELLTQQEQLLLAGESRRQP